MPTATNPNTPTRHSALQFSLAAFAAGLTAPALASVNPDAELIDLCDNLAANGAAVEALLDTQHTIEDERRDERAIGALYTERGPLLDDIWDIDRPATLDGAKAMARAFSSISGRELDGDILEGGPDWIAFRVCDFLAERAVA